VPYGPGGATDTLIRLWGARLATILGQSFLIENRPGGNTAIGAEVVLRAPRDGHTLFFAGGGAFLSAPLLQSLSYDPLRDFRGVSIVGSNGMLMTVNRDIPPRDLDGFIAWVRANPGTVNAASSSLGTSSHLAPVLLAQRAGIDITVVPYPGFPQMLGDLVGGRVQALFGNPADMLPHVQSGALRALAVTSDRRMPQLPDVPTLAERYPDAVFTTWNGLFAPAGTPEPVIATLSRHMTEIGREPDMRRRLADLGIDPDERTPEEVDATLRREAPVYAALLRASGMGRGG
jgi:tripartite-type tricarboxylate transporter receptor subunit TctC